MDDNDQYFLWNGAEVSGPHSRDVITEWLAVNGSVPDIKVALAGSDNWKTPKEVFSAPPPISKSGPPPLPQPASAQESGDLHSVTIEVGPHADLWAEAIDSGLKRAGVEATVELTGSEAHGEMPATQAIEDADHPPVEISLGPELEPFDSDDFIGEATMSPSGRFKLAWNWEEYRFIDGDTLIAKGRGQGLGPGKVTDQGISVLAKVSDKGRGTLFALKPTGKELFKKTFTGPIDGLDVTSCGTSAVCVAFDKDADRILLLDLQKGTLRSLTKLVHEGIVGSVRYDPAKKSIAVDYERGGPVHHYAMDGTFLDSKNWARDRTRYMNGYELLAEAETRMSKHRKGPVSEEVMGLLKRALQQKVSPLTKAKIHRRLGEAIASAGDNKKAVEHLEKALKLDPKIGVKRLLNKLRSSEPA